LEKDIGMNKMNHFSKVLPSLYRYSCAYELEYRSYDMILIYELAYSFYIMILPYRTLCLIIHIIYMIRIRPKLRWQFIVPSGVPKSFTCRFIGSGTRGDLGSFSIHEHGARVYRNR
jgi:hypothetical protein